MIRSQTPLLLTLILGALAPAGRAQQGPIYARCYEALSEAPRLCGFDPETPGAPSYVSDPGSPVLSVSADGRKMLYSDYPLFFVANLDGSDPVAVDLGPVGTGGLKGLALSPAGTRLAYIGTSTLYVLDVASGERAVIATGISQYSNNGWPEWSPDGTRLLYQSSYFPPVEGRYDRIWVANADGLSAPFQLTSSEDAPGNVPYASDFRADWSFDGSRVVFLRYYTNYTNDGGYSTVEVNTIEPVAGAEPVTVFEDVVVAGSNGPGKWLGIQWSPDGTQFAVLHREGPTGSGYPIRSVYTMPSGGGGLSLVYSYDNYGGPGGYVAEVLLDWTLPATLETALVVSVTGDEPNHPASAADGVCDVDRDEDGNQCTLRAALEEANRRPGRDSISVAIEGAGPHTITLSSPLPALTEPLVLDATTQPGYAGAPRVALGGGPVGLDLTVGGTTIRGLALGGFADAGIRIAGPGGNVVEACHLGVSAGGTAAAPNGVGVRIDGSPDNTIGGATPAQRNVISGNAGAGVLVTGEGASGNVVAGNYVGTNASGAAALGNAAEGVRIEGAPDTRVGGATVPERNVIAGNGTHGVYVEGPSADGTLVQGNYIGVTATGTAALGNGTDDDDAFGHRGVLVRYATDVVIGGPTATPGQPPGNVIAASAAHGIYVRGDLADGDAGPSDDLQVLGNLIGLDAAGQAVLPNGAGNVVLWGAVREARIGQAGGGNVIASEDGEVGITLVDLGGPAGAPDGAHIAANTLGLTASGNASLGEMGLAVLLTSLGDQTRGVEGVRIGGEPGEGNRISAAIGIVLEGEHNAGTVVASNTIGLLADGALAWAERDAYGIVALLADSVRIAGNAVGGQAYGVVLASNANVVTDNFIGTNPAGASARPNTVGLYIPGELVSGGRIPVGDRNIVGAAGAGNVLSGNTGPGLLIGGAFEFLPDARAGVRPSAGAVGLARRTPSGRRGALGGEGTPDENVVAFNKIGTSAGGTRELGNGRAATADEASPGVRVQDGRANLFLGNVISGNGGGIAIDVAPDSDSRPEGTVLAGNLIGGSVDPESPIPNQYGGVFITQSSGNVLTALPLEEGGAPVGNVIEGNGVLGVRIAHAEGFGHANVVRQSSFRGNDGPSIAFVNGDDPDSTPPGVPLPPQVLRATASEVQATLRVSLHATGPVDVFVSASCGAGNAEGVYRLSVDGSAGAAANVPLGYDVLGVPGADEAVGLYLAVTSTTSGEAAATSAFSDCIRLADEATTAEVPLPEGFLGDVGGMGDTGLGVEVTDNPGILAWSGSLRSGAAPGTRRGGGTLYAARYDLRPETGPVEGEAPAPDGSTVTPNAVASARYWTLRQDALQGITYTACLDFSGIEDVNVPGQLLVVQRETGAQPWRPHASMLDPETGFLCAAGLTAFGDLGIGADSTVNPVPNEPGPDVGPTDGVPSAFALSTAYPNPSRTVATLRMELPQPSDTRVVLYDAMGREVAVLVDGGRPAGRHVVRLETAGLPAGVYVVRMVAGDFVGTRRLTVVR